MGFRNVKSKKDLFYFFEKLVQIYKKIDYINSLITKIIFN